MVVVVITVPLVLLTRRKCAGSGVRDGGRAAERGKFCGKFLRGPENREVRPSHLRGWGARGQLKSLLIFLFVDNNQKHYRFHHFFVLIVAKGSRTSSKLTITNFSRVY